MRWRIWQRFLIEHRKINHLVIALVFCCFTGCRSAPALSFEFIENEEYAIRAWGYFAQGLQEERNLKWEAAAIHFEKAASLSPRSARAYTHLAWNLIHLHMEHTGLKALALAEKYASFDDHMIYFDMGNVYRAVRDYRSASRCYRKSLEIFPHFQKGAQALTELPKELPEK